ncbi:RNA pseudouridine synthase [Wolbachia pipientis]|uniref:Pseudouridine synthase n=1 Tax=Wolbachia pipientis TaxID=955 RepID=A0A1E7QJG0_WOLPI|nr:RluA family pseudouridine synthase [Wolbachia pipientis]OEY86517.1 RNA pseudouridine synthase [Wolbachia pipientis]
MEGKRLDTYIAYIHNISRSKAQKLIQNKCIKLHGCVITDNDYAVKPGEEYVVDSIKSDDTTDISPNFNIKLDVVYEDDYIIIINKQSGITVHPGAGTNNDTLLNAVIACFPYSKPGIVHRLDKETSGLMVIAKNEESHTFLSTLLSKRIIKREYLAVVWGTLSPLYETIKTYIAPKRSNRKIMCVTKAIGKSAITHYSVKKPIGKASLVNCKLETGRTHQIRVHMSHIGHSIVGDQVYGKNSSKSARYAKQSHFICNFKRQALHAYKLGFYHPKSQEYIEFKSDLPYDMKTLISEFENLVI